MEELTVFICATPRSGSYLLCDYLNRWGLPFGDEWLSSFHQSSKKWQFGVEDETPLVEYMQLLSERERQEGKLVVKVMPLHLRELKEALDWLAVEDGLSVGQRLSAIFPNPHFVWLRRRDRLAQAVSHLKARQTGRWVHRGGEEGKSPEPCYSYLAIRACMDELGGFEGLWSAFFERENIRPFPVDYEDLLADAEAVRNALSEWLGEGLSTESAVLKPRFGKAASPVNREWYERFREDEAACAGSRDADRVERLKHARLDTIELAERYELGSTCSFVVTLRCPGAMAKDFRGLAGGAGWWRVAGLVEGPELREPFQFEFRPQASGRWKAEGVLPFPKRPCSGTVKLLLSDRAMDADELAAAEGFTQRVEFVYPPEREAFRQLFPGAVDLVNGWRRMEGFGCFLDERFPWIYHSDHEWWYVKPQLEAGGTYHIFDTQLGWLEVDPDKYPRMRRLKDGQVLVFTEREREWRRFLLGKAREPLQVETNRPEHLQRLRQQQARRQASIKPDTHGQ